MKKAVTIFLLALMVSIQTPLGQLLKLPLLIEHYLKHQGRENVSLIGFLKDHYAARHQDADLPEDESLPFKNITINNTGYAIVTPVIESGIAAPLPLEIKIFFYDPYTPQQHSASIFHPPRA